MASATLTRKRIHRQNISLPIGSREFVKLAERYLCLLDAEASGARMNAGTDYELSLLRQLFSALPEPRQ